MIPWLSVFKKCRITTALDGSENDQVNMEKLSNCIISDDYDDDNDYELLEESESDTDEECNYYVHQEVWRGR